MAAELGKAYVQIVPSAQGISGSISSVLGSEATSAGKTAGLNIASGIGTALKGAATTIAAGAAVMTGAIVKGTADVAAYGDNIDKMSQKMGLSAQAYQEWDAVMQHSGTSMESMKASMKTLANAAETGNKAFAELGITEQDLANMSQQDLFEATIKGLQDVDDTTQRTYLAGKLLGRGATELGALLNTSAEDTQAMRDRVRELGGVMSDDAVKAAAAFQDNLQDMKTAVGGLGRSMMSELLPNMNEIISGFTSLIAGEEGAEEKLMSGFQGLFANLGNMVHGFVDSLKEFLPSIISGITEILPEIISLATELIVALAEAIVDVLPELITTVVPALAQAAVEIIMALGEALITAAPGLLDAGAEIFEMLRESFAGSDMLDTGAQVIQSVLDGITAALPGLLTTGVDILTNVANGILSALPGMISTAGQIVTSLGTFLMQNAPTILNAGADLLLNLVNGIIDNLPEIAHSAIEVVMNMTKTLAENYPAIIQAGFDLIIKLVLGLSNALPDLMMAVIDITNDIVKTFMSVDWIKLGGDIMKAIIDGLVALGDALIEAILTMCKGALDAVKKFFGIDSSSDSGNAKQVGRSIARGLARGITENADVVTDAMEEMRANVLSSSELMTLTTSTGFTYNNNDAALVARMDAIIAILAKYFPEIAERQDLVYNGNGVGIDYINRALGALTT